MDYSVEFDFTPYSLSKFRKEWLPVLRYTSFSYLHYEIKSKGKRKRHIVNNAKAKPLLPRFELLNLPSINIVKLKL